MANLDYEAETEALLVDYRPMAEPSEPSYNSRAETSSRTRVSAHRSTNGSTQSDDELLDVIMPAQLETASGFANKDGEPERIHSKSCCIPYSPLVFRQTGLSKQFRPRSDATELSKSNI